jgi:hypothetical protein
MNYEITEEQIKQLARENANIKEWFPEVFKTKLEVGKWYWYNGCILNYQSTIEDNIIMAYGIIHNRTWHDLDMFGDNPNKWKPATDSEVLEALTNEFKKQNPNILFNFYRFKDNILLGWNLTDKAYELFKESVFTKLYTKEEAEKMLNAKII